MKNIITKEMVGLIFKSKTNDGFLVVVYGTLNYGFSIGDGTKHSEMCEKWAEEHGSNFIVIRFKNIMDNNYKSMPLEKFFQSYELLTQKFDNTKWIS